MSELAATLAGEYSTKTMNKSAIDLSTTWTLRFLSVACGNEKEQVIVKYRHRRFGMRVVVYVDGSQRQVSLEKEKT